MSDILFPVAETFYSLQGEGVWAGTPMWFLRLAGCSVGKYRQPEKADSPFQVVHPEHSTCTSFSGRKFVCDTDYRKRFNMSIVDILRQMEIDCKGVEVGHVVITGGEPLMHACIGELMDAIAGEIHLHIETSGTVEFSTLGIPAEVWVTCSPKEGFLPANLPRVDELKFVIGSPEDVREVELFCSVAGEDLGNTPIFLQPIEEPQGHTLGAQPWRELCVQAVLNHPHWRLSLQAHKIWGVR